MSLDYLSGFGQGSCQDWPAAPETDRAQQAQPGWAQYLPLQGSSKLRAGNETCNPCRAYELCDTSPTHQP